jgi:Peptidase family M28
VIRTQRLLVSSLCLLSLVAGLGAQSAARGGRNSIEIGSLKEWLAFLSSDELQGRATYTEGLGTAATYIAERLKEWGVKPVGDNGTYFQTVRVVGVRNNTRSTVTVDVNGQSRTFKDGEGITLPRNQGGRQTIAGDIVFAGYALQLPAAKLDDYAGIDAKGKVLVWLGPQGPARVPEGSFRLLGARSRQAIEKGAVAVIGPTPPPGGGRGGRGGASGGRGAEPGAAANPETAPHFTTVQRYDRPIAPAATAQDDFFEFLFRGSDVTYAELKDKAAKREPLPAFVVKNAKITFNIDPDYSVVRTQLTKNVVGVVEGTDPALRDTYVVYGAHYDHSGYLEGPPRPGRGNQPPPDPNDRIFNGADDDGSGTVAIMAIARAFAQGPKPKRSLLFVWHAGEERGLLGSRYNADYPVVPLEKMVAHLNMDMVGRNRDNKPEESNTVYVVGSDRISSELHDINEEANASLPKPLTMDYEMNDPADPQSIYTRSDHYSYAVKGIPIVFYFTGLHPDYHQVSDTVDKIVFDKIQRVAQLAYETGRRVASLDRAPARDNLGPRVGKGWKGKVVDKVLE